MKKLFLITSLILFSVIHFATAQSKNSAQALSAHLNEAEPSVIQFLISIPDEYSSRIVRENGNNSVNFLFKKSDGTTEYLFQLNRVPEDQWNQLKNQFMHPYVVSRKNGYVYYALTTDKHHIKGDDNDDYQKVYNQLHQLINSIVITEATAK